jgi:hypothetical protein
MNAGDRFKRWLESLADSWKDRFKGWAAGVIGFGFEVFTDVLAKSFAPKIKPLMDKIEANTEIPPELKPLWDEIKAPTGEVAAFLANRLGGGLVSGALGSLSDWLLRPILAGLSYNPTYFLPKPEILIGLYFRYHLDRDWLYSQMRFHGIDPKHVDDLLKMAELRLPSEIVFPLILRDPAKYTALRQDLKDLGIDEFRIMALEEMAYRIPGVQDIIRYVVKEAYAPEIYKAFGQDQEYPSVAEADARKSGVRPDMLLKEWISHWDLPSVGQGFEMLHRGIITDKQLELLLKAKDIMPFWRDKLTAISWSVPGRIEVRMMAQLGLVDKDFIKDILRKDGLAEEYLDIVADMNLVRGIRTDIQTRYTKGWLNSEGVKSELEKSGLSAQVADRLYQWIVTNVKPDRTVKEKDLTVAQIVKAVNRGLIPRENGIELLVAMSYDRDEADLVIALGQVAESEAPSEAMKVNIDTVRRRRRQRVTDHDQEISELLKLGLDVSLATAYAFNDDIRLTKAGAEETV